ncbi:hypothetical protein D3C85_1576350 [compost metagenome]
MLPKPMREAQLFQSKTARLKSQYEAGTTRTEAFLKFRSKADLSKAALLIFYERRMIFMLKWSVIFLVVALIAGIFGFFNLVVAATASIAKILFFVFLVLFIISLFTGRNGRRSL